MIKTTSNLECSDYILSEHLTNRKLSRKPKNNKMWRKQNSPKL